MGADVKHGAGTLLGREHELAELGAAWEKARGGRGGLVILAGEPGIGKTRMAEAAAQLAEAGGAAVVWGHCWESGGAPAYWPWPEIVRELVAAVGEDVLERELGPSVELLARLQPALHRPGDFAVPPPAGDDDERFALFEAVSQLLRRAAAERPLMLLLDDVHAADEAGLQLLHFVARAVVPAPVLLLATARSWRGADSLAERPLLAALLASGRRIQLGGLEVEHVAALVAARSGVEPSRELAAEIHATTEGNPFFSTQIAGLLAAEGEIEDAAGRGLHGLTLDAGVTEAIGRRLEALDGRARELLEVAAVVGRDFSAATVESAAGADRAELLEAIDVAVAAGVVGEVPARPGRFRFSHGLIREVLYEGLVPGRRMRLHGAVANALERSGRGNVDELAHHALEAAPVGEAARAVDWAERAAAAAVRLHAHARAVGYLQRALSVLELVDDAPSERRVGLTVTLGEAQLRAGGSSRSTLLGILDAARELDRPELLGRAALALSALGLAPGTVDAPLVALLEEALAALPAEDSSLRARLLGRLAANLYYAGEEELRLAIVEEAIAMARRLGDPATIAEVLTEGHLARWGPDTTEEGIAWAEELLALGQSVGDEELGLAARTWRIDLLLEMGDIARADLAVGDLSETAERLGQPRVLWRVPGLLARRAVLEGRFEDALKLNAEAAELGERHHDPMAGLLMRAQVVLMRYAQGSIADLEPLLREAAGTYRAMPVWRCALALANAQADRRPQAQAELDMLAREDFTDMPRDNVWMVAMALLADTCREVGDRGHAAVLEELLSPFAGRNVVSPQVAVLGPVERYLGLLAAARGDVAVARERFAVARERAARLGARPLLAHLAFDEARVLAGTDDRAATRLLDEAAAIAAGSGMELLSARIESARAGLDVPGAAPAAAGQAGAGRLLREGDVWTLTLDGHVVRLKDSKGVRYIAKLLASPGVELHAVDLIAGTGGEAGSGPVDPDLSVRAAGNDDAGPLLDAAAKSAYRARLEELREDVEEAERFGDSERASRAREEMDYLAQEIAGAVGLGGRDRKAASTAERARVNATRAIKTTLKRIAEHDEHLGRELETTVRTGIFCSYGPDPRRPVEWEVLAR